MSKKKQVHAPKSPSTTRFTRATEKKDSPVGIYFSFKYLALNHPKFNIEGRDHSYLRASFERFRDLSSWTMIEFRQGSNKTLRTHKIDWARTTESGFGIPNEDEVVGEDAYQFALSVNEHGRVHGFIINETFYVVWLDPEHNLYA